MTERYMVDDAGTLIDMETRNMYELAYEVVDLLNELNDENEQLKKDNKEYIRGLELSKTTSQSWASDVRELRKENYRLEEENEQLKHDASVLIQSNKDYRIENEQLKKKCEYMEDVLNNQGYEVVFNGERWVIE